jgi:hypothetical protein
MIKTRARSDTAMHAGLGGNSVGSGKAVCFEGDTHARDAEIQRTATILVTLG